ncbi:MAG TPA: hypothetical protein VK463_11940 [Desulfomonilaceae bacterium]|nr:hypothetical protein [Desulfomonilaceae bacterium]
MKAGLFSRKIGLRLKLFVESPEKLGHLTHILSKIVLCIGIVIWTGVQTGLVAEPLWTRPLLPEAKDTLTYVLKTRQMEECFSQNCPALQDLREQMSASQNPEVARQSSLLGSRIFPIYHPLWSAIILGVKGLFGLDLETAYKVIWTLGPAFFGLAFACLLTSLWGPAAAGFALMLLAFKIFPDTGLHYVEPSNLTMGLATLIWARIISKRGDAPWSLVIGSLALITMHPIGRVYSAMAACMALVMPEFSLTPRRYLPIVCTFCLVALAFVRLPFYGNAGIVTLSLLPSGESPVLKLLQNAVESFSRIIIESVRLGEGLFGSIPVFCGAVVMGYCLLNSACRVIVIRLTLLYGFFIFALLFWVSSHPGDVQLRMWIPLVVILFGAVGRSLAFSLRGSADFLVARWQNRDTGKEISLRNSWVVIALAVLCGYCFQMVTTGAEHVVATAEHMQKREPLRFEPSQPELLLSRAKPGDRVLYTNMTAVPYYFIHGAMRLGAVFYHPAMEQDSSETAWLTRPDLRFAVTYNPAVYHPAFDGLDEYRWWVTAPDYRYSALNTRQIRNPLMWEGSLRAADVKWIEIEPQTKDFPKELRLLVSNPGKPCRIGLIPPDQREGLSPQFLVAADVPANWSGWVNLDVTNYARDSRFKIAFPEAANKLLVQGIVFGKDTLHWPWSQKAMLTFMPKYPNTGPITRSYDPAAVLPDPLKTMDVKVLDDNGSTVLFEINR